MRVAMKCVLCRNQKLHHTLAFHVHTLHVGTLWWHTLPPNSLVHTQVAWHCLLLHFEAQEVVVNMNYDILLDLIKIMSHHPHLNQHP